MSKNNLRFDLFAMVEWTAAIGFICALLAGSGGRTAWTTDFKLLPQDDATLLSWLEQQGRTDVEVTRENSSITLEMKTGVLTERGQQIPLSVPRIFDQMYAAMSNQRSPYQSTE